MGCYCRTWCVWSDGWRTPGPGLALGHQGPIGAPSRPGSCTFLCLELPSLHSFLLLCLLCLLPFSNILIPLFPVLSITVDSISPVLRRPFLGGMSSSCFANAISSPVSPVSPRILIRGVCGFFVVVSALAHSFNSLLLQGFCFSVSLLWSPMSEAFLQIRCSLVVSHSV